jgi:hypothetical protein
LDLRLGCPFHNGENTGTTVSSRRTQWADSRGGDDGARWRTESDGDSSSPANTFGCFKTRGRAQAAPGSSSPPRAAPGGLLEGGKAATVQIEGGGRLALRAAANGSSGPRVWGHGGGAAGVGDLYKGRGQLPRRAGPRRRRRMHSSDSGASLTRRRPEEGDNGWGPPVSHSDGARAAGPKTEGLQRGWELGRQFLLGCAAGGTR